MDKENIAASNGGPELDYEAIGADLPAQSSLQYGVKITWKNPDVFGNEPEEPFMVASFSKKKQAKKFAAMYDPELAPAAQAESVELLYREALEVYGEWAPISEK